MENHLTIATIISKILLGIIFIIQIIIYIVVYMTILSAALFLPLMIYSRNSDLGEAIAFAFDWSSKITFMISIVPSIIYSVKNYRYEQGLFSNIYLYHNNKIF